MESLFVSNFVPLQNCTILASHRAKAWEKKTFLIPSTTYNSLNPLQTKWPSAPVRVPNLTLNTVGHDSHNKDITYTGTIIKYPLPSLEKIKVPYIETQGEKKGDPWHYVYEKYSVAKNSKAVHTVVIPCMPVGVGLTHNFWYRFIGCWNQLYASKDPNVDFLIPDLMGTGDSSAPQRQPWTVEMWADQLKHMIRTQVRQSGIYNDNVKVIIMTQGATFGIGLLAATQANAQGLFISNPPPSRFSDNRRNPWAVKLIWFVLSGPFGAFLFNRVFPKKDFLRNFSAKNLFYSKDAVDDEWLDPLIRESTENKNSRFAVYSFLSGFWERDFREYMRGLQDTTVWIAAGSDNRIIGSQTVNTLLGRNEGEQQRKNESIQQRVAFYENCFPNVIPARYFPGSNVLPWECVDGCCEMMSEMINKLKERP